MENGQPRPLYEITDEIMDAWPAGVSIGRNQAAPYIAAMRELTLVTDMYGMEDGTGVVRYFLSNASTWRGDVARRIKAELRGMIAAR